MSEPRAWEIGVPDVDGSFVATDPNAVAAARTYGWRVTPLVAAPAQQTVEEMAAAVDDLITAAHNTESCGDPYHDTARLDAALTQCRAAVIALVVAGAAPPEDGRPTYEELAAALRGVVNAAELGFISRASALQRAQDVLSRIPPEEP